MLENYLLLKYLHIISSVLLVGTGFGSAFYLYFINRTKNIDAIAEVSLLVVKADFWFTTPAAIIQPVTGVLLAKLAGFPLTEGWLAISLGLYVFAGVCWLPVVWLQIMMAKMAVVAAARKQELPDTYWKFSRYWTALGCLAFPAALVIFWLMVNKPDW